MQLAIDVMFSNAIPVLLFFVSRTPFWMFCNASVEHDGWNLLILLRRKFRSEKNVSSSSSFWPGDLYKQFKKHLSLSNVISATICSWRSDKSVLVIMGK